MHRWVQTIAGIHPVSANKPGDQYNKLGVQTLRSFGYGTRSGTAHLFQAIDSRVLISPAVVRVGGAGREKMRAAS